MPAREIELHVDHRSLGWNEVTLLQTIKKALICIDQELGFPEGDLSIALLSDEKVAEIHDDFLDDPTETDVITFPGDPDMEFAGEICVSADRAQKTHTIHGTHFSEELTLYIVHGLLHLAGLNDKTPEQSVEMRKGEKLVMDFLKQQQSIPTFTIE